MIRAIGTSVPGTGNTKLKDVPFTNAVSDLKLVPHI